jgi:hypothetical protein
MRKAMPDQYVSLAVFGEHGEEFTDAVVEG